MSTNKIANIILYGWTTQMNDGSSIVWMDDTDELRVFIDLVIK